MARKAYMTRRRRQVLREVQGLKQPLGWKELARRCGIPNYRNVKRIVSDLKRMELI